MWRPNHVLHFGADSYGGPNARGRHPWGGELYMFAMYNRALTDAEVAANYAAGVDNSDPSATTLYTNVTEDSCTPLPSLSGSDRVSDWDNDGPLSRGQTLSSRLTALPACGLSGATGCGTIYTDSACSLAVASASTLASLDPANLYYKPGKDDYSYSNVTESMVNAEGVYSRIAWKVSDSAGGESEQAEIRVRVSAVNDAPVALPSNTSVYMDIPEWITVNGTDVDGEDLSRPIQLCNMRITRLPSYGTLKATVGGAVLAVNDIVSNITLVYQSQAFAGTAGKYVVAVDDFDFELIDTSGHVSPSPATMTINVLSGLEAVPQNLFGADAAEEEELKKITLRGINQRGGSTWFRLVSLPKHGSLYQYDPAGSGSDLASYRGDQITALPTNVSSAATVECDAPYAGWRCASLLYLGDVDYFSYYMTRDGQTINTTDDDFVFVVESDRETSAHAGVTVRVNNVNDLPTIVAPSNVSFDWSSIPGETWAQVAQGVQIVDKDRGAGFCQIGVRVNKGTRRSSRTGSRARGGG